jgi:hypothetical protein
MEIDAPIPGENLTSDERNHPWRRAPENVGLDDSIEAVIRTLEKGDNIYGVVSMLKIGLPVSFVTETILMKGIEMGKFPIDTALLIAGPVSHLIVVIARAYEIKYDMGLEEGGEILGEAYFNLKQEELQTDPEAEEEVKEGFAEVQAESQGFMAGPSGPTEGTDI